MAQTSLDTCVSQSRRRGCVGQSSTDNGPVGNFVQYTDGGSIEVHVYLADADISLLHKGRFIEAEPQPNEHGSVIRVRIGKDRRNDTRLP